VEISVGCTDDHRGITSITSITNITGGTK